MIELFTLAGEKVEIMQHSQLGRTISWLEENEGRSVWIRCTTPDEDALSFLSEVSHIEPEYFREVIEEEERPKISAVKHMELVYSVPVTEEGDVVTKPFYVYIKGNLVITIERVVNGDVDALASAMRAGKRKFLFKKNVGNFVVYLLDKFNDDFLRYIDRIAARVDVFSERGVLAKESIAKIYDSSVTLSYFNQALVADLEVLNQLRKSYHRAFTPENRKQFAELYFDLLQVLDTEKIQRDSIANLFNMQAVIASNRLNDFMKKVTVVAILVAVPTFISGIYGMNVKLPFQESEHTFWLLIGIMATIASALIILFRAVEKR